MIGFQRLGLSIAFYAICCLSVPMTSLKAAELIMFESDYCEWCEAWHEEIGPIYPKTAEGRRAPLRVVDIHDRRPRDLEAIDGVRFTPTFVMLDDRGREVGRINGYPGEDFFWGLLADLIDKLPSDDADAITDASIELLGSNIRPALTL
jgi:protein-disulfide isomerase